MDLLMTDSDNIPDVIMEDAFQDDPATSGDQAQSLDLGEVPSTLVYKNEKGDLIGPEGSARSVDEYLQCKLCEMTFAAVKDAMVHYNSELHKKVLSALAEVQGLTPVDEESSKGGKRKAPPGEDQQKRSKTVPADFDGGDSGLFVDDKGSLWGPERDAKTLGEFKSCRICSVSSSSFKTAKEHYSGNKHAKMMKRKARDEGLEYKSLGKKLYHAVAQGPTERDDDPMGLMQDMRTKVHREAAEDREAREKEKMDSNEMEEGKKKDGEDGKEAENSEAAGQATSESLKQIKPNNDGFCYTCMAILTSKQTADLHYSGRKHAKMLAQQQHGPELTKHGKPVLDLAGAGVPYCTQCEVMCVTMEQLEEHRKGEKHLAVVEAEKQRQEDLKKAVTGDLGYGCRICDIRLNSKQNYLEHLQSKKHLKKFRAKEEEKLENRMHYPGLNRFMHGEFPPNPPPRWGNFDVPPPPHVPPPPPRWQGGGPRDRMWEDEWREDRWREDEWREEEPPRGRRDHFPSRDIRREQRGGGRAGGPPFKPPQPPPPHPPPGPGPSQGVPDLSKAISNTSMGDLSETILNLLPKEALLKLALEALTSKSQELVATGSGIGGEKKGREERGENWNEDKDYQSYQSERNDWEDWGNDGGMRGGRGQGFRGGRDRGFERGRGGGGFSGPQGRGRSYDSNMDRGRGRGGFGRGFGPSRGSRRGIRGGY